MLKSATAENLMNRVQGYFVADVDDAATTKYYGFINKDGKWYILKEDTAASPKTYRYDSGSSGYPTAWTGRAGGSYDYPNEKF